MISSTPKHPDAQALTWRVRQRINQESAITSPPINPLLGVDTSGDPATMGDLVARIRKLYDSMDYQEARTLLKKHFPHFIPALTPRDLTWCLSTFAWLESALGNSKSAIGIYEVLLRMVPSFTLDPRQDSPTINRQLARAKTRVLNTKTGFLSVESSVATPATVFVNGRLVGRTPFTRRVFSEGLHFVHVELDGYMVASQVVKISKKRPQSVNVQLKATTRFQMFDDIRGRLPNHAFRGQFPESVRTLAAVAAVRNIVILSINDSSVWVGLFDVNGLRVVNTATIQRDRLPLLAVADRIFESMHEGFNPRAPSLQDAVVTVQTKIESRSTPWWVWTAIGIGAAAAIIVPTYLLIDQPEGIPRTENTGTVVVDF